MPNWYALDLICTEEAHEAVEYALMEAGSLGTETGAETDAAEVPHVAEGSRVAEVTRVTVSAYFETPPAVEGVRAALAEALRVYGLESSSVREMRFREVEGRDWLA